jgi:hypothetical protein
MQRCFEILVPVSVYFVKTWFEWLDMAGNDTDVDSKGRADYWQF